MTTQGNSAHPEARRGELFISNMSGEHFARFDWESKRQGAVAYDGEGRVLNVADWFPVFIGAAELAERGDTVSGLRRQLRERISHSKAA